MLRKRRSVTTRWYSGLPSSQSSFSSLTSADIRLASQSIDTIRIVSMARACLVVWRGARDWSSGWPLTFGLRKMAALYKLVVPALRAFPRVSTTLPARIVVTQSHNRWTSTESSLQLPPKKPPSGLSYMPLFPVGHHMCNLSPTALRIFCLWWKNFLSPIMMILSNQTVICFVNLEQCGKIWVRVRKRWMSTHILTHKTSTPHLWPHVAILERIPLWKWERGRDCWLLSPSQHYVELHEMKKKEWDVEYKTFMGALPDKEDYLKQLKALRGLVRPAVVYTSGTVWGHCKM